jgi:hypothetical protein
MNLGINAAYFSENINRFIFVTEDRVICDVECVFLCVIYGNFSAPYSYSTSNLLLTEG